MFQNLTLLSLIQKGGITMVLLGLFSLISMALMLERAWYYHKFRKNLRSFSVSLRQALKDNGLAVAAGLCSTQSRDSSLANVFLSGYRKRGKDKAEVYSAMELAGRGEIARLERFVGVIGTIGSTAPFIGLFGTVLGIIRAFSDMAMSQGTSPAAVADGIAEALVATATGLLVAVPAVIAYNYFVRSGASYALELETLSSEFIDSIAGEADGLEHKK